MSIQLLIIVLYLIMTVVIGLYAKKRATSANSFHGSGLGVLLCVAAGTGEWLGGTSTTGVSEYGFVFGLSSSWYTLANGIGVIILALFFAKLYRRQGMITVPGIIERFIGVKARVLASILLTFVMIAVGTAQLVAAGTLGVAVLGLDYQLAVIIMGIGFIIYTLAGGMRAVGYTNMIHLVAMYGGIILALLFSFKEIGDFTVLRSALPVNPFFRMTGIGFTKVASWIIASILGACTAQAGIQPLLAAKDGNVAKKAALITAFLVAPFGILTAILGMVARVKFPSLVNPKLALPILMMDLHPVVGGIVLASIMAAILSTVSPIILASGTMLTQDIYRRMFRPTASDREILVMARLTTGLAGILCMVLAIFLYEGTKILDMIYFAYTLRGSLFVVLLFGIYWQKTTQRGSVWAMLLTALVGFIWVTFKAQTGFYPIHPLFSETYAAVITALLSTFILSYLLPDKKGE